MARKPRTLLAPDQLWAHSKEHLDHEIRMFRELLTVLPRPEPASHQEAVVATALLESLVVHGRLLLDFLFPDRANLREDDVIADDYMRPGGDWASAAGARSDTLASFHQRVSKEVAHLTSRGVVGKPIERTYSGAILGEIDDVLRKFAEQAAPDRLAPDVRQLVEEPAPRTILASATLANYSPSFLPPQVGRRGG